MAAIVVALVLQAAWRVLRVVLEGNGHALDPHLPGLSFAFRLAADVVIGAALIGLGRRLVGARRYGVWSAAAVYLAMAAAVVAYEVVMDRMRDSSLAISWFVAMRDYGWAVLDVSAIAGLAVAAGRRGVWLAPPAAALTALQDCGGIYNSPWSGWGLLGFAAGSAVLLVLLVDEASRHAATATETGGAARAMRRLELVSWAGAAISTLWLVQSLEGYSFYVALATWIVWWAVQIAFIRAVWSLAKAALRGLPAWFWFASATCMLAAVARSARSWFLTITRWWGRFEDVHLATAHWSSDVLPVLAVVSSLVALAIRGRGWKSGELVRVALAAAIASAIAFAAHVAYPNESITVAYIVANAAAARAYRIARPLVDEVPRARVA